MHPSDLIQQLQHQGLRLTLDQDRLLVAPRNAITKELADLIRTHKPALIDALRASGDEPGPDPADVREFYEERAAVMEYDAGMTRQEAETEALRLAVVRFKLHLGEGGGSVIGHDCTDAEILDDLKARYGKRLKEAYPINHKETQP